MIRILACLAIMFAFSTRAHAFNIGLHIGLTDHSPHGTSGPVSTAFSKGFNSGFS